MNGVHDLGGMQGFGKVEVEAHEPAFHAPWEGRVLGLVRSVLYTRESNIDMFRHAQERVGANVYLSVSYYHRWLLGVTRCALEAGLVTPDEIEAGHALHPGKPVERRLTMGEVKNVVTRAPFGREPQAPARFQPGDRVRTLNINPMGHTRLPRYARAKTGVVERVYGCHVFPDSKSAGKGDDPQWLYAVAFDARELWGEQADPSLTVSIDAFEPYLERA
jgi:nitrile hydratase